LNLEEFHSEIKESKRIKNVEVLEDTSERINDRMRLSGLVGGKYRDSKTKKKKKDNDDGCS